MEIDSEWPDESPAKRAADWAEMNAASARAIVRSLTSVVLLLVAGLLLAWCRLPVPDTVGWAMLGAAAACASVAVYLTATVVVEIPARHRRIKAIEARVAAMRARLAADDVNFRGIPVSGQSGNGGRDAAR